MSKINGTENNLFAGLNIQQKEAIQETEGFVRVIAGAGSGKTRVLTTRFAYLTEELGILPDRIMCVTFTNKASKEMKSRIKSMIGNVETPYICTFHSFCSRVLREDIDSLGFTRKFKVLDAEDQLSLIKAVYKELGIKHSDYPHKKALNYLVNSACKGEHRNFVYNYEEILTSYSPSELDKLIEDAGSLEEKVILGYIREQRRNICLDFNDLINLAVFMFKVSPRVLDKWKQKFDYVQVDEFQDASKTELQLLNYLSLESGNLFVVGDPNQTIYGFRGSDINCILSLSDFLSKLRGEKVTVKTIKMNINYRSTPEILNMSNSLIKRNKQRLDNELETPNNNGIKPIYHHARGGRQEATWIVEKILELDVDLDDVAILYRNNASSRAVEEVMMSRQMPYELLSGFSFYQRKEVKDVLAVLSLLVFEDDLSLRRIINNNSLGIGAKRQDFLIEQSLRNKSTLYQALVDNIDNKLLKSTKGVFLVDLINELKEIRETGSLEQLVNTIIKAFDYEELFTLTDEKERYENLLELKDSMSRIEDESNEKVDIEEYLNSLALYSEADKETDENVAKVKLMTIHVSKGLEFPIVFVLGVNEGSLPTYRAKNDEDIEEERRVAYVGITRAKKQLYLTDSEGFDYEGNNRLPSRFIFEIDEDLYDFSGSFSQDIKYECERMKEYINSKGKPVVDVFDVGDSVNHKVFGLGIVKEITRNSYVIDFKNNKTREIVKNNKVLSK